ncbi:fatty acyl-CoA reductase wat-like isoform X2 [Harmonia axyridis]|uniref:fatty acyl-CoA reductase wat-like isoform X2 n=1 Tax=Harmonia axyridis TaxID=115357 RepID=UPI001E2776B2|nr:fatty acyl-CoA reductase wat-like isoform X2 [Harmonia axyridis]XP_045467833.1 fatty acyl-CoA reductase wat-like isoform X2 [Harmonia axyridis]
MATSQILGFYEETNVFITGGTGFLGKLLIEKLLRSTSVSTLYLLVRPKKGKDVDTRIKNIFEDVIFEKLHQECPKFIHRIVGVNGDVSLPDLGISKTDRQMLVEKIDIIFHVAATMRFDENLKHAYCVNVKGAQDIIKLGKDLKHLKSLMHVSTAFSNCHVDEIEEKFYDHPIHYEKVGQMLETMTESEADKHTKSIIGLWPNTYSFTKSLAESMIRDTNEEMPVGIFRPSIVISTYKEPIEGWIDNLYGPTGLCVGSTLGLLRVTQCDTDKIADLVPGDMCVSALIAAAWDIAQKHKGQSTEEIPIYNYVSMDNNMTWGEFGVVNLMHAKKFPFRKALWLVNTTFMCNTYMYMIMKIFYHLIPAIVIDAISALFFKNLGLWKMYRKIHKLSHVVSFFCLREWTFSGNNIVKLWNKLDDAERKLFFFDMKSLDLWAYYKNYLLGIRKYIMKDSLVSLEAARRKQRIFSVLHNIMLVFLYFTMSVLVWTVFQKLKGDQQPCVDRN